jgi:endonuclease G
MDDDFLGQRVRDRYKERARTREALLQRIDEKGVLGAADPEAAARRAQHKCAADGPAVAARGLSIEALDFEAIVEIDDSDHFNFMGRGQIAGRCVCRIVSGDRALGTGFLVAPGVLLTNNHVIGSAEAAEELTAEFDYEFDVDDQPRVPVSRFRFEPRRLFATSPRDELDYTFVAVASKSDASTDIASFGWIPMLETVDKILVGEPAVIIQHPRGEMKRVCLFAAQLVDKLDDHLHYTTDTDHGSSGSCVVNRSWQLVALHHAATKTDRRRRGHDVVVNEGVRISSILRSLRARANDAMAAKVLRAITDERVVGSGRPQVPPATTRAEDFETTLREKDEDHFADRDAEHFGYKPRFLGTRVPLPELPPFLQDDLVRGADGPELKYTHYSLVMSRSRRLPIYTAVNIHGAQSKQLARTDRDFEAADVWAYDPRIERDAQLGPKLYDETPFDFGHMVRREDPVWGDLNTARMANDDTFYITNAAPQHENLNRRSWQKLENAILDAARKKKRKVTVLTGPVLTPQDPTILGVQVPTAFWKIVVYMEGGSLLAHGFIQHQTLLVENMRIDESLDGVEKAAEFQVPIREIARMTSLDFGPLLAADRQELRRRVDESVIEELFGTEGSEPAERAERDDNATAVLRQIYELLARHFSNGSPARPRDAPVGRTERRPDES